MYEGVIQIRCMPLVCGLTAAPTMVTVLGQTKTLLQTLTRNAQLAYGVGTSSNRRGANSFAAGAGGAVTGDRSMPAMYGGYKPELLPRMFGLDQCARYRSTVAFADRKWGVAGLHNTGTNLLFRTMTQNCKVRRRRRDSGSGDANVNVMASALGKA